MREFVLLTFLVLLHTATAQQCNTPILRDIISVDTDKTSYTRNNLGDSPSYVTGLPLLDSQDPLIIRTNSPTFTKPFIDFIQTNRFSPNYWITALDIQQGPAGSGCTSTAIIENIGIELKVYQAYTGLQTSLKAGVTSGNSVPYYNWKQLGGTVGNGRITRLSFEPIRADGMKFEVLSIDPLTSSVQQEVCLRVEIYGCEKDRGSSAAPSVNTGPLHQYNLVQASADTYGNLYADSSYSGLDSDGYMTGGTGVLTDGIVGSNAETTPAQWLGWKRIDTTKIEVIFLLKAVQIFDRVNLFFWEDSGNKVSGPVNVRFTDQNGNEFTFESPETIIQEDKLRVKSFMRTSPTQASYFKVSMEFEGVADYVLLTEVELVRQDGINAFTNLNATTIIPLTTTTPTTPTPTTNTTTTTPTTPTPTPTTNSTTATTTTTSTPTTNTTTTIITTTPTTTTPTTTTLQATTSTEEGPIVLEFTTFTDEPTIATTTTTDDVTTPSTSAPTESVSTPKEALTGEPGLNSQLIAGLIFVIIFIIILILLVIVLVIFFYYLRSKGKRVQDMACVGKLGGFRRIYGEADPESGGKKRFSKPKAFKRGAAKSGYEVVNGKPPTKQEVTNLDIPTQVLSQGMEEPMSPELLHKEDLYIYAPVDAIYSSIAKGRKLNKTYEQSEFDLSLPSTPLDMDQGQKSLLRPLTSIYETPALLIKEEGPLELTWLDIQEKDFLGNGHFGEVCLATLVNYSAKDLGLGASGKKGIDIAIKKLSRDATQETKDDFSKEVKFMARLDHANVIRLLGVCLDEAGGGCRFLAMEYMVNGDLAQFLKDCDYVDSIGANLRIQEVNQDCMVYMGQQVAAGMEYLSDRNYIHRDLSARNCLVGCNYTVKVADFGMSQDLYSKEYFKITGRAILPIRWMPNEGFYGKFTIKSDVWSFGVTLWEIFNKCEEKPYGELSDHELIQDVLTNKKDRVKLEKPVFAPDQGWELIGRCVDLNPDSRPCFVEIRRELEEMCKFQIEEVNF